MCLNFLKCHNLNRLLPPPRHSWKRKHHFFPYRSNIQTQINKRNEKTTSSVLKRLYEKTGKVFYCPVTKAVLLGQSEGECQKTAENLQAALTQGSKGLVQHHSGTKQSIFFLGIHLAINLLYIPYGEISYFINSHICPLWTCICVACFLQSLAVPLQNATEESRMTHYKDTAYWKAFW